MQFRAANEGFGGDDGEWGMGVVVLVQLLVFVCVLQLVAHWLWCFVADDDDVVDMIPCLEEEEEEDITRQVGAAESYGESLRPNPNPNPRPCSNECGRALISGIVGGQRIWGQCLP